MRPEQKEPYRIYRVGGWTFPVYLEYDGQAGESCPVYPDFEERPAYTREGRPFATSAQESCPHGKSKGPEELPPGDCGDCGWFFREQTPCDPIGICMCPALRRENESETEERM